MGSAPEGHFSHIDSEGRAKMVDVGPKPISARTAIAKGELTLSREAMQLLLDHQIPKGDVLTIAKIAGIQAAKRTSDLIPLCHPIPLSYLDVSFEVHAPEQKIIATAEARTSGQTGVEMEALTAVSVALLTAYDMMKSVDKGMVIGPIRLIYKEGGKSGTYKA